MSRTESFAERLKKALDDRGLRSVDLARMTGIDKSLISNYLSGRFKAKQNKLYLIAKALNVPETWLMGYDEEDTQTDELTAILEDARNDPDKRMMFSLAKNATPEQIKAAIAVMQALKGNNQ